MRFRALVLIGAVLLLAPASISAQSCKDWGNQGPSLAIPGGWVGDLEALGNTLYATTSFPGSELWVLDATDPMALAELGSVDLGGPADELAADGNYLYATVGGSIVVLDATNPVAPVAVNTINVPGGATLNGLDVEASRLWATTATTLYHYDVTDPLNEIAVSSLVAPSDTSVTYTLRGAFDAEGDPTQMLLHVNDFASHSLVYFRRVTVTSPAAPVWGSLLFPVIGNGLFGLGPEYMDVRGQTSIGAVDTFDGNGVRYAGFDTGWLQNPLGSGSIGFGAESRGHGVAFRDDTTALWSAQDSTLRALHVIDLSTPLAPVLSASVPFPLFARKMVAFGDVVVLQALYESGTATGDLVSLDLNAADGWVTRIGGYRNSQFFRSLAVDGTTAWTLDFSGVQSLDLADPAAPALIGSVATSGTESTIRVSGTQAWVTVSDRLEVLDISDAAAPAIVGTYTHGTGSLYDFVVDSNIAHIGTNNGYLSVDVTNPAAPVFHRQLSLGQSATDIALWDGFAYLVSGGAVEMIDVVNNPHPEHTFTQITGSAAGIETRDGVAYVAADGLFTVSLPPGTPGPPPAPTLLGSLGLPTCSDVILDGDTAYLYSTNPDVTYAVDISDPAAPVLIGSTHAQGGLSIVTSTGALWSADSYSLVAVPAHCASAVTAAPAVAAPAAALRVSPNPAAGVTRVDFTFPRAMHATVTVHDVTGRRVATLRDGPVAAGNRTFTWDPGAAGEALPSGVYFVRLEAGERTYGAKLALIR